ncbi:FAD/NAD(P)-binding protein [Patulibacter sp.]|uniref:FAD/NAD(P)-binding protein n=1 Tax=Patulibacter sp. TaxID=1912859 RepID=UPI00271A5BF3|nr:FAD/NAD(P)-binding domain-containing protein [Patulibacter sp.]MDO9410052.1 FAD/NAD(P)-binding protein [Patulibacter sp.]
MPVRDAAARRGGEPAPLRVALVGLGPKGLFALERLLDRAAGAPLDVVAYEPHPVPGAGPVYDPSQPAYLRMNNAAVHVDLWWPGNATVPAHERRSFAAWDAGRHGDPGAFVPRAAVGRYLADGLATVLRHADPATTVRVVRARVVDVRRVDGGRGGHAGTAPGAPGPAGGAADDATTWSVTTDDGGTAVHDEVLLATGHVRPTGTAAPADRAPGPTIPAVFPVDVHLGPDAVPAGAVVAVRGFALTAIDAALALTEGRGGRFVPATVAHRLRYEPGPDGVAAVVPFSRTGLPMVAKPAHDLHRDVAGLDAVGEAGRARVRALGGGSVGTVEGLRDAVAATAGAALVAVGSPCDPGVPAARLRDGDPVDEPAVEQLARSLDVAVGARPPGAEWALGHAWRTIYPAVVERLGGTALDLAGWDAFRALAARLERIAFGPSAENVAKLLALVEAGVVDLTHVAGGSVHPVRARDPDDASAVPPRATVRSVPGGVRSGALVRSAAGERAVDVVVDAVLSAPGVPAEDDGPVARLVRRGELRLLPGRRGLDVGPGGACRDAAGDRVPGLSAIGRPTEDVVIGHDTLSRTLHRQADEWARRVVAVAVAAGGPGAAHAPVPAQDAAPARRAGPTEHPRPTDDARPRVGDPA